MANKTKAQLETEATLLAARSFSRRVMLQRSAAAGAILVGLLEAFSSFWASAFKEVIVFTLIIPVLLWRSLTSHHVEEEE